MFLGYYVAFTLYLVFDATEHHARNEFRTAMVWFGLPPTALTLLIVMARAVRRGQRSAAGALPE